MRIIIFCVFFSSIFSSCRSEKENITLPLHLQQYCVHRLTDVIVYDIFSPPVASRIYAYCNLAWYEAMRLGNANAKSVTAVMHGFDSILAPLDVTAVNYSLAAVHAFFTTAKALIFSKDSLSVTQNFLEACYRDSCNAEVYQNSVILGDSVASVILHRSFADNYKQTRGMPRYSVFKETGKWQQTPPDYADATEPHWPLIKPLLPDSASQFMPPPPPAYSLDPSSVYAKQLEEVYALSKSITPQQDTIAHYWDDNPFVTHHEGHFTFATKKTTPGGHWMGITQILTQQQKTDAVNTALTYALTSAAMFDGFIVCWAEKYHSRTVRPVTVIREWKDPNWNPLLQTPPFPEYTSGHSVISAAAAGVLTFMLGTVAFQDTTEMQYLGLKRSFDSVKQAADEAGISRLYGGIHYRAAIEAGKLQGERVAELYRQQFAIELR